MTMFAQYEIDTTKNSFHAFEDGRVATSAPLYLYEQETDCVEAFWAVWFEDCLYIFNQEPFVDEELNTDVFDTSNSQMVYHKHFMSDFKDALNMAKAMYHIHMSNVYSLGSTEDFKL